MSEEAQVLEAVQDIDVDALEPGEASNLLKTNFTQEVGDDVQVEDDLSGEEVEIEEGVEQTAEDEGDSGEENQEKATEAKTIEDLQKQIDHMQKFIAKQSNEVGRVRQMEKQLEELKASRSNSDADIGIDDIINSPKEALKKLVREQENENLEQNLTQQIQREKAVEQNKAILEEAAPDISEQADAIGELLVKDGASKEVADSFRRHIYEQDPIVAFNLYQRVLMQKKIERLESQAKNPATVLQSVKSAARRGPTVTARSGASSQSQGLQLTESMIENMSPAEVKEAMKTIRNQKRS